MLMDGKTVGELPLTADPHRQARIARKQEIIHEIRNLVPDQLESSALEPHRDLAGFFQPETRENLEWFFDQHPEESLTLFSDVVQKFTDSANGLRSSYTPQELGGNSASALAMNAIFLATYELSVMSRSPLIEELAGPFMAYEAKAPGSLPNSEESVASLVFMRFMAGVIEFTDAMESFSQLHANDIDVLVMHAQIGRVPMDSGAEAQVLNAIESRPNDPDAPGARMFSRDERDGYDHGPRSEQEVADWIKMGETVHNEWSRQRQDMKAVFSRIIQAHPSMDVYLGGFTP